MRVHSGEKPFVCSQCNYSCNQADRLRIYMRIHSREKIVMSKLLINCLLQMPYRFFFHISNICDNIKDMWVGGRRHFGRREQPGKEDQGGQWIHGCITSSLKKIPTELIHPNVSDLPGLLLQVFSPSTAPSTNNTHEQKLGKWDISGRDLKKSANCLITICLKIQKVDNNGRLWLLSALFVATATHCAWWPE